MTLRFKLLCAPALLGLLLAGCGSSSGSSSSAKSATSSKASRSNPYGGAAGASSSTTPASTATPVMLTTNHTKLGTFLVAGPKRLSVYVFDADKGTTSHCYGKCAVVWPPVLGSATAVGGARAADLGSTRRKDGTEQVTYKGHPLYYFVKDKATGDTFGAGINSFGAKWYVVMPSGSKIDNS